MAVRTRPLKNAHTRSHFPKLIKHCAPTTETPRKHIFHMTDAEYAAFCRKRNIQNLKDCLPLFSWFVVVIILYVVSHI